MSASMVSECKFDHLQLFVDALKPLEHYKAIETRLNDFVSKADLKVGRDGKRDVAAARAVWQSTGEAKDPATYQSHGQDLVEQLLYGFGYRVTAAHHGPETTSMCVSSQDTEGTKYLITAVNEEPADKKKTVEFDHFAARHVQTFKNSHAGQQGFGVICFELKSGEMDIVLGRYTEHHPTLLRSETPFTYTETLESGEILTTRILDACAYYEGEKCESKPDVGTLIRYVERSSSTGSIPPRHACLPGMNEVKATFESTAMNSFDDHWVSNVKSRKGFLDTMEDILGFQPKVDFNAGVVAAGEAQIESTVTGNSSLIQLTETEALRDRTQVFLPTNNALTPVGHVHWYIEELGQGIQHAAARVEDLPVFVQRANDFREITGEGFTFLMIPRTYYGLLSAELFVNGGVSGELGPQGAISLEDANAIIEALKAAGHVDIVGAVSLEVTDEDLSNTLSSFACFAEHKAMILAVIRKSIYVNLWKLLRDQIDEATYTTIVRNKILIDVQGEDVLMQIFTSLVLQRKPGAEAPFIETIQRLCSGAGTAIKKPVRAGCGGFGIRNFLTLFLSIEVSKAITDRLAAEKAGDQLAIDFHAKRVQLFTDQLVEANPILTEISDCMTGEGVALAENKTDEAAEWERRKQVANNDLMACSAKYNNLMKAAREEYAEASKK